MMKCHLVLVVLALAGPSAANSAYVVYSDGGAHTLGSASTNYYGITSGSTLSVLAGTSITPLAEAQYGDAAIFASSGNVNVYGGSITGGTSLNPTGYLGGDGIFAVGATGSMSISAGQITGGAGSVGGTGLALNSAGPTTISGGSITGGNSVLNGGQGGIGISYQGSSQLTITGGTFSGGSSPGSVAVPSSALTTYGGGNIEVSGGLFLSEIVVDYESSSSRLDFFGTGLNYSNGILSGTLSNGDAIDQIVNIIGYTQVNTVAIVNSTNTEVSFVPMPPAAVPEPSSIAMIALGLGGAALFARSRRG